MKVIRTLLIIVAVVCIGIALSYPIRYYIAAKNIRSELEELSAIRRAARNEGASGVESEGRESSRKAGEPTASDLVEESSETVDERPADVAARESDDGTTTWDAPTPVVEPPDAGPAGSDASMTPEPMIPTAREATENTEPTAQTAPEEAEAPKPTALAESEAAVMPVDIAEIEAGSTEAPETTSLPATATAEPSDMFEQNAPVPVGTPESTTLPVTETADAPDSVIQPATADSEPMEPAMPSAGKTTGAPEPKKAENESETAAGQTIEEATAMPGSTIQAAEPEPTLSVMELIINDPPIPTPTPRPTIVPRRTPEPAPSPTPDRRSHSDEPPPYPDKEKVVFDENRILPELKQIYELNHDLIGWICIEDTVIDYPVVQRQDQDFYLTHDFYGKENVNGQIIMDAKCDVFTPSYNLVISGHHMRNGSMFGNLPMYKQKSYWETHKVIEFDTLLERKRYVIFAAFESADYDKDEKGFRYNVDIQYKREVNRWLEEVYENQLYTTGIEVAYGDEFLTLTTCDRSKRRTGRFVLVARRIREGEELE